MEIAKMTGVANEKEREMKALNMSQAKEVNGGYGSASMRTGQLIAKKLKERSKRKKKKEREFKRREMSTPKGV